MGVVGYLDELRGDPDAAGIAGTAVPLDGPLEDIVDPQVAAHIADRLAGAVVLNGAGPGDHRQAMGRRQPAGDLLGHTGGEVGVIGGSEVLERQDDDLLARIDRNGPDGRIRGSAHRRRQNPRRGPENTQSPQGNHHHRQTGQGPAGQCQRRRLRGCGRRTGFRRRHFSRIDVLLEEIQFAAESLGRLEPLAGILLQAPVDDLRHLAGKARIEVGDPSGGVLQDG